MGARADDGLGAAMSLAGARDGARDEALAKVADAAERVALAMRQGAQWKGPHDQTAAFNAAAGWDHFAFLLRGNR